MALVDLGAAYDALSEMAGLLGVKAVRHPPQSDPLNPDGKLLRRFERNGTAKLARMLDELGDDLFKGLTEEQVNLVFSRLNGDITQDKIRAVVGELVEEWAVAGAEFGASQVIGLVGNIGVDWALSNQAAARWAQNYTFELVQGITNTTQEDLQRKIGAFVTDQGTIGQLRDSLEPTFGEVRAQMIAVTETTRAYAEGNREAWAASGVVQEREWRTNNDEIVCVICMPMDGVTTGVNESFQHPTMGAIDVPGHVNCRCWTVPFIDPAKIAIEDEIAFIEGSTIDPYEDIRPPAGRAPKGKGEEYAQRRRIVRRIETHTKWRASAQAQLNQYRGQTSTRIRWRIDVARERVLQLDKVIRASLLIANDPYTADWGYKTELIDGIMGYTSALRT